MPVKKIFIGEHKQTGEKVYKVVNPVGLMSYITTESGSMSSVNGSLKVSDVTLIKPKQE